MSTNMSTNMSSSISTDNNAQAKEVRSGNRLVSILLNLEICDH